MENNNINENENLNFDDNNEDEFTNLITEDKSIEFFPNNNKNVLVENK